MGAAPVFASAAEALEVVRAGCGSWRRRMRRG